MPTRFSFLVRVRAALIVVGLVLGANASAQDTGALQLRKTGSLLERKADLEIQKLGLEAKKFNEDFVSWKRLNEDLQQRRKADLEVQKLELEAKKLNEDLRKADLEAHKLDLETKKLDDDLSFLTSTKWVPILGGILLAFITGGLGAYFANVLARQNTVAAVDAARAEQAADLDQATHEKRLESYQGLVKHTSPFAIFFPEWPSAWHGRPLDRSKCEKIGQDISKWFFESGLLLSAEARDAYFRLARALTRASSVDDLCVPKSPDDVKKQTQESVKAYRKRFYIEQPSDNTVETWQFGPPPAAPGGYKFKDYTWQPVQPPSTPTLKEEYEFKDYVFLQTLSSRLRTKLTEDIRSRLLPGQRTLSAGPPPPRRWFARFRQPHITSLSPASTLSGTGSVVLTVTGTNFKEHSIVSVDRVPQLTVFVSATELRVDAAPKKETAGTLSVVVVKGVATTAPTNWTFT
jgi:hypothetical protein